MAVREVNHPELEFLIGLHYYAKIPLYIWGGTGIGKSETARFKGKEVAKELNRTYVEWNKLTSKEKNEVENNVKDYFIVFDIRLSQFDPSDLKGLPFPEEEYSDWKPPRWLKILEKAGCCALVFFDEINLAPPSIQASAYQLILDRALGEISVADGVVCLAAGNRVGDQANVFDLPLPLQNRFTHVTLRTPAIVRNKPTEGWTGWAMNNGVDPRIITFIQARPELLSPEIKKNSDDRAFATPRTWGNYCSALIKNLKSKTDEDLKTLEMVASAAVGYAAASEFVSFMKFQREIDFDAILADPQKAADVTELDLKYSLLSLMAEWYDRNHKKTHLDTLFKVAKYTTDEFAILMLRMAKIRHPHAFMNNALDLESWDPISEKYGKFILT